MAGPGQISRVYRVRLYWLVSAIPETETVKLVQRTRLAPRGALFVFHSMVRRILILNIKPGHSRLGLQARPSACSAHSPTDIRRTRLMQ